MFFGGDLGLFIFKINPVYSYSAKIIRQNNCSSTEDLDDDQIKNFDDLGNFSQTAWEDFDSYKPQLKEYPELFKERENSSKKPKKQNKNKAKNAVFSSGLVVRNSIKRQVIW